MAHARSILIPTYFLFLAAYTTAHAAALSFDYNFTVPGDREHLKFINASYAGRDRIILTDDSSNLIGRVVHRKPVRLWDDRTGRTASFTTSFRFAIVQDSNMTDNLSRGDGMAFFLGPFPATTPPPGSDGGLLGLFSNPNSTGAADSRRPPHTLASSSTRAGTMAGTPRTRTDPITSASTSTASGPTGPGACPR
ncbi:hypothetical protein ZWY2020_026348 [Hordeum vulgare]|nr:hypothetical protein ZWY2020_026348 [Hordeum vulgare]